MKIFSIMLAILLAAAAYAVTVDGFCYLDGSQSHSGIKVKFIKVSPSAVTDSCLTAPDGYFSKSIVAGIYVVEYSLSGFRTDTLQNQVFLQDATLASHTLIRPLSGITHGSLFAGTYRVLADLQVPVSDSLTIFPGTTLRFMGPYRLSISGKLKAIGTQQDSIHFTTDVATNPDKWRGISFINSNVGSQLSYCLIEYASSVDSGCAVYSRNSTINLDHCTFQNNFVDNSYWNSGRGAALFARSSHLDLRECLVTENDGQQNGGIYALQNSNLALHLCRIENNYGGGISVTSGVFVLDTCNIVLNHGTGVISDSASFTARFCHFGLNYSEGLNVEDAHITVENCLADSNFSGGIFIYRTTGGVINCQCVHNSGAGFFSGYSDSMLVSNCRFSRNVSNSYGGVGCNGGSTHFLNCAVDSNVVWIQNAYAGGVFCQANGRPIFENCRFSYDSAGGRYYDNGQGGAVYALYASPVFLNCTFFACHAADRGGCVYLSNASPTFSSCNFDRTSGTTFFFSQSWNSVIQYCNFFSNSGDNFTDDPYYYGWEGPTAIGQKLVTNVNGDSADIYENIFEDPLFADTANGNYNLLPGSPCIDAGDPGLPHDPDGTVADIGAFFFTQDLIATPRALNFGSVGVGETDSLTVMLRNFGAATVTISSVTISPAAFSFTPFASSLAPGDSELVRVRFAATQEGLTTGTLRIVSDAVVNDTILISLAGEGGLTPAPVHGLVLQTQGSNAALFWQPVDTTLYGNPVNVTAYLVYFAEVSTGPFWFLGMATDTSYVQEHVVQFAHAMFYQVTAYTGDVETLRDVVAGHVSAPHAAGRATREDLEVALKTESKPAARLMALRKQIAAGTFRQNGQ